MSVDEIGAFYNLWIVPQERLIHLKHLELAMVGPRTVISFHYRYLFLVPFLIACPALETFILHVCHICVSKCDLFLLLFSYFTLCFILANEFFLIFYLCRWSRLQYKSHLVIDPWEIMELPRHHHENIKHMTITSFCPITRLMELIFYILENAASLQCLTLDNRIRGFEKDLVARILQDTETHDF
jgi:hypothetical protein